ncbi:hypothetical protein PENSPDRAFT_32803 [Peniophora sp. CONT]|nr:hypothetical protein PENSPDRAFT_32803 [Peniophora sp. CONT]
MIHPNGPDNYRPNPDPPPTHHWLFELLRHYGTGTLSRVASPMPLGSYGRATASSNWRVTLSPHVDVLGPFPIHAREQHFLSPAFPLNLAHSIDLNATYPSSYADGGRVGWSSTTLQEDGNILVSYPKIRWQDLRATEGWAAFQHHSVLRTTLTVHPPSDSKSNVAAPPSLLIDLIQGSFFALLPQERNEEAVPEWYSGNIYDLARGAAPAVRFPTPPSVTEPTTYDLFVSGDYEIRLFGDPGNKPPTLDVTLKASFAPVSFGIVHEITHDVIPDFVDGFALGNTIGLGVRAFGDNAWSFSTVQISTSLPGFSLSIANDIRLAPNQLRVLPLRIAQDGPLQVNVDHILLELEFTYQDQKTSLRISLPVRHRTLPGKGIIATYLYAESMPTAFAVNSPTEPSKTGEERAAVLALHGAGVDAINMEMWHDALPQRRHSWTVLPTGLTPWGLDWHGPSALEAWASVDALRDILASRDEWAGWRMPADPRVVLVGHSNGGQGAWHIAARWPDKVIAVVPAAGYIKAQAYVPLIQSHSAHYVDPALRGVLESAYTPDDNDLFLSNLAHHPILAVHGGADDNVPVWHGRALVSAVELWAEKAGIPANITFKEDPGKGHWYDTILDNEQVSAFIESHLAEPASNPAVPARFTLTVAAPEESGSLCGWEVIHVKHFGRLARVSVDLRGDTVFVKTSNARSLRLGRLYAGATRINIDGQNINAPSSATLILTDQGWVHVDLAPKRATYRASSLLTSPGPLTIIIPDAPTHTEVAAASRIAHVLQLYYALDSAIISDSEASRLALGAGNIIALGNITREAFVRTIIKSERGAFKLSNDGTLSVANIIVAKDEGALFLHPHPVSATSSMLVLAASDDAALERLVRLIPMRTGIAVPDWLIITPVADTFSAAGVRAAGVWDADWKYSAVGSWHD